MTSSDESPILALRSASFGYSGRAVVSGVSFDVEPGEVIAVLGPNGSGKSTLMRGILGLNEHIDGEVRLFGTPAARFKDRTRIGYVPQRHTLSGSVRATVGEIVEVGRLPHRPWYRPSTKTDREAVVEALTQVGLADRLKDDVSALSGGQHRRVLIARALAAQPDILIMDEPTAGVDTASQEVLAEVLGRLAAQGVTMMIVTHEVEALTGIITRVVDITHGHVAFDGSPSAYAARFASQLDSTRHAHPVGAHQAHHDHEVVRRRPPYAPGPLDEARLQSERKNHG